MDARDRERINARYDARLDEHGATSAALAGGPAERRALRFDVLCEVGIRSGDRVLDLGCGFGDLLPHLAARGLEVDYLGVDINPRLVEEARRRHPEANFRVCDIEAEDPGEVDYVVSTSSFNLRLEHADNYEFVAGLLRRCLGLARKGVAIDFLSSYVDFRGDAAAFHYEPERVFSLAKQVTKRVNLRHDYPLFEFCLYLYPDFSGWR